MYNMSIKELNLIYSTRPNKGGGDDPFDKDIETGDVGGFVKQDDALSLLLSAIEVEPSEVEWYRVQAKPQQGNPNRQIVYHVSICLRGDAATYEFEMDCQTGEVVKIDSNMPNINSPSGNGGAPQTGTLPSTQNQNNQNTATPDSNGGGGQGTPSPDDNEGESQQGGVDVGQSEPDNGLPDEDAINGER